MHELVPSQIDRLLRDHPVAHIGVISYGVPYVTPISYVWQDGQLWFRTAPGRRLTAIEEGGQVCCEISEFDLSNGDWQSVLLMGSARVDPSPEVETEIMRAIREKYRRITRSALELPPDVLPDVGAIVAVMPDEVSGRSSGRGVGDRMRPGRL
jgi:nitroimidazol reductase NimA-like FMN-containing flavoprotein (pyridoxamine 5'-phosphate oxidase superfamily)